MSTESNAPSWPSSIVPVFTATGSKVHGIRVDEGLPSWAYEWTLCHLVHADRAFVVAADFEGDVCRTCEAEIARMRRVQETAAASPFADVWQEIRERQVKIDAAFAAVEALIARLDRLGDRIEGFES